MKLTIKISLFICALLSSSLIPIAVQADVSSFIVGRVYSGVAPFDSNDANESNSDVRTHDTAGFRTAFSLTESDTGAVIKYEMGSFTLPSTLVNGVTPPTTVAYFDPLNLPTGNSGCQNISLTAISDPPAADTSGITADGQTAYCALASPIGGITLDIPLTVSGNVPNGTILAAPTITFYSDNNAATSSPNISNDGSATFGMGDLTLTSSPQWDLTNGSLRGGLFVPASGPNGEDGFVMSFNIGIHATGSRKGIEALSTAYFTQAYDDADFPNAQLVNWEINSPGYSVVTNTYPGGCAGWAGRQPVHGNKFDNTYHFPTDKGSDDNAYDITNGGECAALTVDNTSHIATIELTNVDWSLADYPTQKGYNPAGVTLVNPVNPEDSTNEWWVASKSILIWAPVDDLPADGVTYNLTSSAYLFGTSITGQSNVEPVLTANDNTESRGAMHTIAGSMSKRHTPFNSTNPLGLDSAPRDPNVTSDSHVNQVSPGQVFESRIITRNTGTSNFGAGYLCDRIDNTRLSLLNRTSAAGAYATTDSLNTLDDDTGIITRVAAGSINSMLNLNYQLGVGGTGTNGSGWNSFSGETSEYNYPLTYGSDNADSGCADSDATWFDSITELENAGYSLQQVSRVRGTYDSFDAAAYYMHYIPLQARGTYAYSGTDNIQGTFSAGDSTLNSYSTDVALWEIGGGVTTKEQSGATYIFNNEYVEVSKSSPTHPDSSLVTPGAEITYEIQINLTTTGSVHTTGVTAWDVLPNYLSYNTGSSTYGGVGIADPICANSGLPTEIFPSGTVEAGLVACKWILADQTVTKTTAGHSSGNLPILSFNTTVDISAPNDEQLLNTSFADSTNNTTYKAVYSSASTGFVCREKESCSYSNWALTVSANPGIVLSKSVDYSLRLGNEGIAYTLKYGTIGNALPNVRLLDVLPYSGDNRGSTFSGTLNLSGAVTLDANDTSATVFYTKNNSTDIIEDPYDNGHNLSNTGANTPTSSNWCMETMFGGGNCPASFAEVTGIMILPFAGESQNCGTHGTEPCLNPGVLHSVSFPIALNGNKHDDIYYNKIIGDSPGLLARSPGSNTVTTTVVTPDLVLTKKVYPSVVNAGATAIYTLVPKNNTGTGVGSVGNVSGTVITVTDNLPEGVSITSASDVDGGNNWDCSASIAPSAISCTYDNSGLPIGIGGSVGDPIVITATADYLVADTSVTNTASINLAGQTELSSSNNTASATLTIKALTGKGIRFEPNHQSQILPGNVTFYSHVLSVDEAGTVVFTVEEGGNVTPGWSQLTYRDSDCDGTLNNSEGSTSITGINFGLTAGERICLINKVYAPANASAQDQYKVTTNALFTYTSNKAPITLTVTDLSTSAQQGDESKLVLRKTVENLTQSSGETETINMGKPGDQLIYRIYYRNAGIGGITSLELNDYVPAYTSAETNSNLCDSTPDGLTCTPARDADTLVWHFNGTLVSGAEGIVSYKVVIE